MKHLAAVALATALAIAGCAAPGGFEPGPASRTAATEPARPTFATQLAGPATFLGPMPTAIVLLKPGDLNRNRAFCQAFTSRLPTAQAALARSVVAPNLILTRWLVQLPDVPPDRATDCDFLVGTYDYARAARLAASVRLSEGRLSGPGPFLLMVIPDTGGLHVAGLDGSAFSPADFDRFIDAWGGALRNAQRTIGEQPDQPGIVRSLFNLVTAILRTAASGIAGLVSGVVTSL